MLILWTVEEQVTKFLGGRQVTGSGKWHGC